MLRSKSTTKEQAANHKHRTGRARETWKRNMGKVPLEAIRQKRSVEAGGSAREHTNKAPCAREVEDQNLSFPVSPRLVLAKFGFTDQACSFFSASLSRVT